MLDTDQLRSFLAIVDTGSFNRAAERVNKTQSAVSMHIRRLEEQLNNELFVKQGRGVRLSDAGEKLIDYARQMLHVEATALSSITGSGLAGRIRLGIPDDYTARLLPGVLTRFVRRHPLVEVSVVCDISAVVAARVHSRDLDLAVVTACGTIADVECLRDEPLHWVARPGFRLDLGAPLPLALGGPNCSWRRAATDALQLAGIQSRLLMASNNHAAIDPIVRTGLAVTVLPLSVIHDGLIVLGADESLPRLPLVNIGIVESPARRSAEALAMAEDIRAVLTGGGGSAAAGDRPSNGHRQSMTRARQRTHPRIAADRNPV
jgi:DNA-binding transcriptional LysR family regulator